MRVGCHRDASRILPDIFDADVDAVADARPEPPHDDERPAHRLLVADGDERAGEPLSSVGDGGAQPAAGSAAVLDLPELMGNGRTPIPARSSAGPSRESPSADVAV
jgi:hypothetical protein